MVLEATGEAEVRAFCLPMSVITMGVGSADFKAHGAAGGEAAACDLVQFVP